MKKIAVCLVSGGMDSCVAATLVKQQGYSLYLLSVNWGQLQVKELENAKRIAKMLRPLEHKCITLQGYNQLSQSALAGQMEIPSENTLEKNMGKIPVTYPPGRDPAFILIALSWLESIMLAHVQSKTKVDKGIVVIGTNKQDSLVYPDCDPEVYNLLNKMLAISTQISKEYKLPITVETPLIKLTKKEVIKLGDNIGAPIEHTWSCYKSGEKLCGLCDPCRIVHFALKDLGIKNEFVYEKVPDKRYADNE